ncbi:hypothetical protein K2173_014824 [Erythroxylum novogranatense]|uniref:Zinc finger family protein n=1 Tax=Erythroxylum novogranatense TaxID=1862640 RepID=A0AAV8TFQ0_9ROSI|nr:hypothetical protein K2173_014824 [Erythroxylum novogranatense]
MVSGWRRAFCTSIPKEKDATFFGEKPPQQQSNTKKTKTANTNSPRISSKFGFFSNPSTPRLQSQPVSSPRFRCRTSASVPNSSPKLQCKTTPTNTSNSPRFFPFFKAAALRLSKLTTRCGVCSQSVRSGQGTAIFTAECSHAFHIHCVAAHFKILTCPVCSATWKELPLFSGNEENKLKVKDVSVMSKSLRVYNDDEPLISPSVFNTIPELEEQENDVEEEEDDELRFKGFFVNPSPTPRKVAASPVTVNPPIEVSLLPESAILAVGRSHQTHSVVLKVRAPPAFRRAPIDLVTVLDVSEAMCGLKSQMMKRLMRSVISILSSKDRLSIVVFSASSKRLLPLRRMTASGRRAARRIVEAVGINGQGMSVSDALKKAAKVIEDRREKHPVSTIMVFSTNQDRSSMSVSSQRYSPLEIPTHTITFGGSHAPSEDALVKRIRGLVSVVVQDLKLQLGFARTGPTAADIPAVYSSTGRPCVFDRDSVRVGDLHAEEERELLVELKVAASASGSQQVLSVRSSFKDPSSQEPILCKELALLVPRAQAVRSSVPNIRRLRSLHVSTRAIAEARRLLDHGDLSGASRLLSSARALLLQSGDGSDGEYLRGLEAELAEVQRRRQQNQRRRTGQQVEEKVEPLTPTSAWRAAERLAKVAIMKKHMNRVSDLHGFENARF